MVRFFCSMAFANATGITALHICGRPTYKTHLSTKGWLSDRGHDPSWLVASYFSHGASCALRIER